MNLFHQFDCRQMKKLNTLFVALAALFWGVSGGIGGILTAEGWNPVVVSFYRGAIGLLFVLIWLSIRPGNSGLWNHRLWFWSVIAGLGIAGNFAFYFISIAEGSVAAAATLMYCAPVFVYLVSFTIKLEKPTLFKWVSMGLVLIGIVLLTGFYNLDASHLSLVAAGAGLLSGVSYALFIFGFKYASPHGSPQAILVIAFTVLSIILFVKGDTSQATEVIYSSSLPLFLLLGVIGAGISFILYIIGLDYTAPAVASVVAMVEPVTAALFGVVILNESLNVVQLLGMGLILIAVTAMGVNQSPKS